MSREEAVEALRVLGVPLAFEHGPVEELRARRHAQVVQKRPPYTAGSQCERKHRHAGQKAAEREARRMWNPDVHAYFCRYCSGWHVGKQYR